MFKNCGNCENITKSIMLEEVDSTRTFSSFNQDVDNINYDFHIHNTRH